MRELKQNGHCGCYGTLLLRLWAWFRSQSTSRQKGKTKTEIFQRKGVSLLAVKKMSYSVNAEAGRGTHVLTQSDWNRLRKIVSAGEKKKRKEKRLRPRVFVSKLSGSRKTPACTTLGLRFGIARWTSLTSGRLWHGWKIFIVPAVWLWQAVKFGCDDRFSSCGRRKRRIVLLLIWRFWVEGTSCRWFPMTTFSFQRRRVRAALFCHSWKSLSLSVGRRRRRSRQRRWRRQFNLVVSVPESSCARHVFVILWFLKISNLIVAAVQSGFKSVNGYFINRFCTRVGGLVGNGLECSFLPGNSRLILVVKAGFVICVNRTPANKLSCLLCWGRTPANHRLLCWGFTFTRKWTSWSIIDGWG